jgi:hypothetical protein
MTDRTWCRSSRFMWRELCILPYHHEGDHEYRPKEEAQLIRYETRYPGRVVNMTKPNDPAKDKRCEQTKDKRVELATGRTRLVWRCILDQEHEGEHVYPVLPVNA